MPKLHSESVKIRLSDVEDRVPSIKALLDKIIEVVRDAQLREYICQVNHTADCFWSELSRDYKRRARRIDLQLRD